MSSGSCRPAADRPLKGVRICLVFEHSLSHYTRLRQEIRALQEAGASVHLLTSHVVADGPPEVPRTLAPLDIVSGDWRHIVPPSRIPWRPARIADNVLRKAVQKVLDLTVRPSTERRELALDRLAGETDLFWVVDSLSLPTVLRVASLRDVRVVYETVDLVPEYHYRGERYRRRALAEERRLIGKVDGFITACDSYADYYMERYRSLLRRRPVVRDNAPSVIMPGVTKVERPLRLLFLGSLMFDRPVMELIDAMAETDASISLTLQGKNYLGDALNRRIQELGLAGRVTVLEPCPPEAVVETAAGFDVGIVALRGENENERRASTSKLFLYLAAGLAVLGSDLPGIARIVNKYDNGLLVAGARPADWAEGFSAIASLSDEQLMGMKRRSLEAAHLHSWERQKPEFVAEFCRVMGRA